MIQIIGSITKIVYVEGTRAECFRKLQEEYPSTVKKERFKHNVSVDKIYPEPLQIRRKK